VSVSHVWIGASPEEGLDGTYVADLHRPMERRFAIVILDVGMRTSAQKQIDQITVVDTQM
jgi:hypothetical protein